MAETYPTGLAQWLKLNRISECQLAREVCITPTALGNLARGRTASVNKRILDAGAHRTQLSFDQILRPPVEVESLIATGDHRIDLCLGAIGKYLHTPEMRDKCRRYISPEFTCSGARYGKLGQPSLGENVYKQLFGSKTIFRHFYSHNTLGKTTTKVKNLRTISKMTSIC